MERWRYAPHVAVAVLAAGQYLPTLRFGFVLDDRHLIVDNTFVRESFSPLRVFAHHEARDWVASTDEFKILRGDADFEELARP